MKSPKPFYPLLLALFPILSLFSANLSLIPLAQLWRPLFVTLVAVVLAWSVCALLLRSVHRGAIATSVLIAGFFGYSRIAHRLPEGNPFAYWLAGMIVAALLLAWIGERATRLLNVLSTFLVLAALGQIALGVGQAGTAPSGSIENEAVTFEHGRPDIFYVILDGYGRTDALKRALGYDNSWFIKELEKRGFYVAKESHANYGMTDLSIASTLNMDTLQNLVRSPDLDSSDHLPFVRLMENSRVVRQLRSFGYAFIAISTGFPPLSFPDADVRLRRASSWTLFEQALLGMTPLGHEKETIGSLFSERQKRLLGAFQNLEELAAPSAKPRFVIAHILAPHPPFVFQADGTDAPIQEPFDIYDANDYLEHVGTPQEYREGYKGQAEFINKKVLESLDALLAAGRRPIIIVQGDHGSKVAMNYRSLAQTDVNEAFCILNAYYVPEEVRDRLYPSITPVNSFRLLLGTLFGLDLPLLPDRSWYSPYERPHQYTDVTDRFRPSSELAKESLLPKAKP